MVSVYEDFTSKVEYVSSSGSASFTSLIEQPNDFSSSSCYTDYAFLEPNTNYAIFMLTYASDGEILRIDWTTLLYTYKEQISTEPCIFGCLYKSAVYALC